MTKFGLISSMLVAVTAFGIATLVPFASADPPPPAPCFRKTFQTKMIKEACTGTKAKPGTQLDAKAAMQKFNTEHKITKCFECHATLAPQYDLKDTALKHYKELGGQ